MASKWSNCVVEAKIATLALFPHVPYSSLSSLHQHFLCCISDTSTFVLQSVLRYPSITYVSWFRTTCIFSRWCYIFSGCCLTSCLLHRWSYEKWQTLETLGGIEGWRNLVFVFFMTSAAKGGGRGRWWWWWRWRWWRGTNRGYDWPNRFFISPTIHNLSSLSWPTNKKPLNWYCSSVTLALSRSRSKKCDAGRGRDIHRPQD